MLHFHQFSSESIDMLTLNLGLSWDNDNFQALLKFSDSGNIDESNPMCNKGMSDVNDLCYIHTYIHTYIIYFKQVKSLAAWEQADVDLQIKVFQMKINKILFNVFFPPKILLSHFCSSPKYNQSLCMLIKLWFHCSCQNSLHFNQLIEWLWASNMLMYPWTKMSLFLTKIQMLIKE